MVYQFLVVTQESLDEEVADALRRKAVERLEKQKDNNFMTWKNVYDIDHLSGSPLNAPSHYVYVPPGVSGNNGNPVVTPENLHTLPISQLSFLPAIRVRNFEEDLLVRPGEPDLKWIQRTGDLLLKLSLDEARSFVYDGWCVRMYEMNKDLFKLDQMKRFLEFRPGDERTILRLCEGLPLCPLGFPSEELQRMMLSGFHRNHNLNLLIALLELPASEWSKHEQELKCRWFCPFYREDFAEWVVAGCLASIISYDQATRHPAPDILRLWQVARKAAGYPEYSCTTFA
ncbi:unnamed protein product [Amoebophrya sp. A120]|nr:unnamed protein product [Amoebophrya sp. A120]|eukprot:GSA120T00011032001.1